MTSLAPRLARRLPRIASALAAMSAFGVMPPPTAAQESVRERIARMEFPDLRFAPRQAEERSVRGVPVFYAENRELPLVTFYAAFEGGVRNFGREHFASASAMPGLLRTGGTSTLPPDSVDERIERGALAMSFGQGGASASSWVNALSAQADDALRLWTDMLRSPGFDSAQVEIWRAAEMERVRRRRDDPGSLAFARFNQIMYGDHPVGWEMTPNDLEPEDLAEDRLRFVHEAVICPDNMVLGVTGDLSWDRAAALLDRALADWPACSGEQRDDPAPDIRAEPGVFVLHKEIEQSVVVMAHSTPLRQGDSESYFASRIGNAILGASGLSSRMTALLRTREGLAYSASSLWTVSQRDDGLVGALTRTKPETTLAAARLLLGAIDSMGASSPAAAEVGHAIDEVVNGFVFNFRTPLQVVVRGMAYRRLGLPPDWLHRYVDGIRRVTPRAVQRVFERHVDPDRMTVLLVGDTTRFDGSPSELGAVTVITDEPASLPRESPRSPR